MSQLSFRQRSDKNLQNELRLAQQQACVDMKEALPQAKGLSLTSTGITSGWAGVAIGREGFIAYYVITEVGEGQALQAIVDYIDACANGACDSEEGKDLARQEAFGQVIQGDYTFIPFEEENLPDELFMASAGVGVLYSETEGYAAVCGAVGGGIASASENWGAIGIAGACGEGYLGSGEVDGFYAGAFLAWDENGVYGDYDGDEF